MRRLPLLTLVAIAASLAASPAAGAATYPVTKTADTADGACDADCSLREAVIAANTAGGGTITVPAGTYVLTIAGGNENSAATGDLDIAGAVTINGAGADQTFIQAAPDNLTTPIDRILDLWNGSLTVNDVTLRYGAAAQQGGDNPSGGAIRASSRPLTITHAALTDNYVYAGSYGSTGGAIAAYGGDLTITDTTISNNHAYGPQATSGAIDWGAGSAALFTLTNTTVSGNTGYWSGAITISGAAILTNDTISGNSVGGGPDGRNGGGLLLNATLTTPIFIRFSTITDNSAWSDGGGILNQSAAGTVSVQRTVLARNRSSLKLGALNYTTDSCFGNAFTSLGGNFDDGSSCGLTDPTDHQNATLNLGLLQDNGGPVQTVALLPGSPAIDPISEATCPPLVVNGNVTYPGPTTDARGAQRPTNAGCDAGAYEVGPFTKPDVRIGVTGPLTAVAGDPLVYHASYTNIGTATATGVVLTWLLPGGDTVTVPIGDIAPGAPTVTTDLDQLAIAGTRIIGVHLATTSTDNSTLDNDASITTTISGNGSTDPTGRPHNLTPPTVTVFETTAVCAPGAWTDTPTSFDYLWLRNNLPELTLSGPVVTIPDGSFGAAFACTVIARNALGTGTSQSPAVVIPDLRPVATGVGATISSDGTTLTCTPGTFVPSPTSITYSWNRGTVSVQGATQATRPITSDDYGRSVTCVVTPTSGSYVGAPVESAPLAIPEPRPVPATPSITNAGAGIGGTLTCSVASFTPPLPTSQTYLWVRDGTPIAGETGPHHVVAADDIATRMWCAVSATNAAGTGPTAISAEVVIGPPSPPINLVPPHIIQSTLRLGDTPSCDLGQWRSAPPIEGIRVDWIQGARSLPADLSQPATTTISPQWVGHDLTCTVTVRNAVGTTEITSAPVHVDPSLAQVDAAPTIWSDLNGTAKIGDYRHVEVDVATGGSAWVTVTGSWSAGLQYAPTYSWLYGPGNEIYGGGMDCTVDANTFTCQGVSTSGISIPLKITSYGAQTATATTSIVETDSNPANDTMVVQGQGAKATASSVIITAVVDPAHAEVGTPVSCLSTPAATYSLVPSTVLWLRDGAVLPPPGAASVVPTYTVTPADVGHQLSCEIQLTNATPDPPELTNLAVSAPIAPIAQLPAGATLVSAPVVATGGGSTAPIQVSCSSAAVSCSGLVVVTTPGSTIHRARHGSAKAVKIGSAKFRLAAGASDLVRIKLTARARAALKRKRSFTVTVTMTFTTSGYGRKKVVRRLTLTRPRPVPTV